MSWSSFAQRRLCFFGSTTTRLRVLIAAASATPSSCRSVRLASSSATSQIQWLVGDAAGRGGLRYNWHNTQCLVHVRRVQPGASGGLVVNYRGIKQSSVVMGIQGLSKVIADHAPDAIKEGDMKNYFGRTVAIDASMSLYQFLVAVRSQGEQLTNENGDTTSHIQGFFFRTIRMMENGVKPVYVFDGKAPELKSGELVKRREALAKAQKDLADATEQGNEENMDKFKRRTVRVNKDHVSDVKELLDCMGVPYVDAPGEAEAQCAKLVRDEVAFAVATEDMDALTFGASRQLRKFTAPASAKLPVVEYNLQKILEGFDMSMSQFIDACILLGCDYTDRITGIGPKKVMDLMKKHGTIEKILENLDAKKYPVDNEKFLYPQARELFFEPDVKEVNKEDLKFQKVDEEKLLKFLVEKHSFSETSVKNGCARIQKSKGKGSQKRVDDFFKATPKEGGAAKRKLAASNKGKDAKKGVKKAKAGGKPRR